MTADAPLARRWWFWFVVLLLAAAACFVLWFACPGGFRSLTDRFRALTQESRPVLTKGVQFDAIECIHVELVSDYKVRERIDAARRLLAALDSANDTDVAGVFETGLLRIDVEMDVNDTWTLEFHIAWPDPQLNNRHFTEIKLVNTGAWGRANADRTAENARERAIERLNGRIKSLANTPDLQGRIRLIEPPAPTN